MLTNLIQDNVPSEKFVLSTSLFDSSKIYEVINNPLLYKEKKNIECGIKTKEILSKLKESDKIQFLDEVKSFYKSTILYILDNIPNRYTLKCCQYIAPEYIKSKDSEKYILDLAKNLPLKNVNLDEVFSEWMLLQADDEIRFKLEENERIDKYWNKIFLLKTGFQKRYPQIIPIVKSILILNHGSAQVERGFSESGLLLTATQTRMNERTLNYKMIINDSLKEFDSMPYKVSITKELLDMAQSAYRSYKTYLEDEKKAEELLKQKEKAVEQIAKEKAEKEAIKTVKKKIEGLKQELLSLKEIHKEASNNADAMDKNLQEQSKNKNVGSNVISELINSAGKLRKKEKKARINFEKLQKKIDDKCNELIDNTIKKK